MPEFDITTMLQNTVDQPWLFAGFVVLGAFTIEDLAIITTALIASQTGMPITLPIAALFIGIMLGDISLYLAGRFACRLSFLKRIIGNPKTEYARRLLDRNLVVAVFTTRCLPGTRLPCYTAFGTLRVPFNRLILIDICAVFMWSVGMFMLFYSLGEVAQTYAANIIPWIIATVLLLFAINALRQRAK